MLLFATHFPSGEDQWSTTQMGDRMMEWYVGEAKTELTAPDELTRR